MAGWNLKNGEISEYNVSEDRIWALFNFVFSDSCKKRNTYKFGLLKALIDNIFNGVFNNNEVYFTYQEIFSKFAENYWNLIVKYDLRQMRPDGKSVYSKIETILKSTVLQNPILASISYDKIDDTTREQIIKKVTYECKKCVIGALYEDFDGIIYSFDLTEDGLYLNNCMYEFMQKYKMELERLNYYAWARFLEQINSDDVIVRVIDKLELATPRRNDLSIYREILRKEFEENNCFYCGKKLYKQIHVDHFIPWSFVKDDKIWNFVLACPTCNERKSNKVAPKDYIVRLEKRNQEIQLAKKEIFLVEFEGYTDGLLTRMWKYARLSGIKEFIC